MIVALLWWVQIPTWLAMVWRRRLAWKRIATTRTLVPRSVIVFRLDQLGDLVLTTPLFRELKRLYPNSRCTVVVRPEYKAVLVTNRNVDEILPLRPLNVSWLPVRVRWLASVLWFYWTQLRRRRFDLAISPRWDVDESLATLLCALTHSDRRVGYGSRVSAAKHKLNRGFDAAFDLVLPPGKLRHEVDRNLAIVEALGGTIHSRGLEVLLSDADREFARELLTHRDSRRVLVAIGIGGRSASRKWPLQRYAECIARLNQKRPVQPVIVCSADEEAEAVELSRMLVVPPYVLSGVQLRSVCAVLEACNLFIGNDTGTAHLAAAMNCPTLVVSRHPLNGDPNHANSLMRFGPRCKHSCVVQPLSGTGPCVTSCGSSEAHCILQVTVDRVISAALALMSESDCADSKGMAARHSDVATTHLRGRAQSARALVLS